MSADVEGRYLADWIRDWTLMGCEHDGYHERTCPPCLRDRILASPWLRDLLAAERREGQRDGWDEGLRFGQLHWATNYAGVYQNGSPLRQAPNPYRDNQTGASQ